MGSTANAGRAGAPPAPPEPARQPARFFTPHEAAVVTEATARLIPGPTDDPAESGSPGAREANVAGYLDGLLSSLDSTPERVHLAGPWSHRHGGKVNHMAGPAPLGQVKRVAWRRRLAGWQACYRDGVAMLDSLAGGDFTAAPAEAQDRILASEPAAGFVDLLFEQAIEGMYAAPEYGGNRDLAGWRGIGFLGDVLPRGYTAEEVERSDGPDPIEPEHAVADLLAWLHDALVNCSPEESAADGA